MALDTAGKRRSSVGVLQPWMPGLPSPTDTPGVVDQADREQSAWTYSGILALSPIPVAHGMYGMLDALAAGAGRQAWLGRGTGLQSGLRRGVGTNDTLAM